MVSAGLAHNKVALVHLHKDLSRAEEVVTIAKPTHRQCALHLSQVVADHFIDKISLDWSVVSARANLDRHLWLNPGCFDTGLFLKLFDFKALKLDHFLQLVVIILTLADTILQEVSLLVKLADILLQALVSFLKLVKLSLQIDGALPLLDDLEGPHVDLL